MVQVSHDEVMGMARGPWHAMSIAPRSWLRAANLQKEQLPQCVVASWAAGSCHAMEDPSCCFWFWWFMFSVPGVWWWYHFNCLSLDIFKTSVVTSHSFAMFISNLLWWTMNIRSQPRYNGNRMEVMKHMVFQKDCKQMPHETYLPKHSLGAEVTLDHSKTKKHLKWQKHLWH